jgi:hypothetical protein
MAGVLNYIKKYFYPEIADYDKVELPKGSDYADYRDFLKPSCTTGVDDKLDLSTVKSEKTTSGEDIVTFPDGTVQTTKKDGTIILASKDGKKTIIYPDQKELILFPDGTKISTQPVNNIPGVKTIHYTDGLKIREYPKTPQNDPRFEVFGANNKWMDYNLGALFDEVKEYTSESLRYLVKLYRHYYKDELKKYDVEDFHSYFMEYLTADIINNETTINDERIYKQLYLALCRAKELPPKHIIMGVKFWNYIIAIINAKNKMCRRYPVSLEMVEVQFNEKKLNQKIDWKIVNLEKSQRCSINKQGYKCFAREYMYLFTVEDLQTITEIVDDHKDEPYWRSDVEKIQEVVNKTILHGGESLKQGESISYGNYYLFVTGKSLEFCVKRPTNINKERYYHDTSGDTSFLRNFTSSSNTHLEWLCSNSLDNDFIINMIRNYLKREGVSYCPPPTPGMDNYTMSAQTFRLGKQKVIEAIMQVQGNVIWGMGYSRWFNQHFTKMMMFSGEMWWRLFLKSHYKNVKDSINEMIKGGGPIADFFTPPRSMSNPYMAHGFPHQNPEIFDGAWVDNPSERAMYNMVYEYIGELSNVVAKPLVAEAEEVANTKTETDDAIVTQDTIDKMDLKKYADNFGEKIEAWILTFLAKIWFKYKAKPSSDEKILEKQKALTEIEMNRKLYSDNKYEYIKIYGFTNLNIKKQIDQINFTEIGELYFQEGSKTHKVIDAPRSKGGELYACRLEVDNVVGPKILDNNNNLVWSMFTHSWNAGNRWVSWFLGTNPTQNFYNASKFNTLLNRIGFFHLRGADKKIDDVVDNQNLKKTNLYLETKYDSNKKEWDNKYCQYGNCLFTLYEDKVVYEIYSAYTGDKHSIWEYKFGWPTHESYKMILYVENNRGRTSGEIVVAQRNGSGSQINRMNFSEVFGFNKIPGAKFYFTNFGPCLKWAGCLVWHPLMNNSRNNIIDYFTKYTNAGYLMKDIPYQYNPLKIEAFTNRSDNKKKNNRNKNKNKNKNNNHNRNNNRNNYNNNKNCPTELFHHVQSPGFCDNPTYLDTENNLDNYSNYSDYNMNISANRKALSYPRNMDVSNIDPDIADKMLCNVFIFHLNGNRNGNKSNMNINIKINSGKKIKEPFISISKGVKKLNEGVPCLFHAGEDGGAAGLYADIVNDPEWQKKNSKFYAYLSKHVCPSYLPTCTGQRSSNIVMGKCVNLEPDCNTFMDRIMGFEAIPKTVEEDEIKEEYKYIYSLKEKNTINRQNLNLAVDTIDEIMHKSVEDFTNHEALVGEPCNVVSDCQGWGHGIGGNGTVCCNNKCRGPSTGKWNVGEGDQLCKDGKLEDVIVDKNAKEGECMFKIENKCYDQYVEADKKYYEQGASIFHSVFPKAEDNVVVKACYDSTKWLANNMIKILIIKTITGAIAFYLYWSLNEHQDFPLRVFKSFVALIFSEIYLIYQTYNIILKPLTPERQQ